MAKRPIADRDVVVQAEGGNHRRIRAGKPIPPDLVELYREAVGEGSAGEGPAYEEQSVEDLQAEVDRRELDVEGSGAGGNVVKADLVAALEADDAS